MNHHDTPSQTSDPRPPMRPGDWSALGLRSGRCLVGAVEHVTAEAAHLRLVSALTGELMDELAVVQWADVERYVVVPASAFETDPGGRTVVPDRELWDFQTTWQAQHERQRHTDAPLGDDEVRLISGTSGRTYPWTVTRKPITETAAEHGIDLLHGGEHR